MNIQEAINTTDTLKPNRFSGSEKINWLSKLDGIIKKEVIDTHDDADCTEFTGYNTSTAVSTELLVPEPYSELYVLYLMAQIDYYNAELAKYNNGITLYNNAFSTYRDYYNRTHMPKQPNTIRYEV